jgi:very-short-patch-repair endonuclease
MTNLMSERARRVRRDMSDAERRLWNKLRDLNGQGFHFRQQAPIGPYIADFCDHTAKLVVEVDGAQHGEPKGLATDRRRTRWLESQGYRVLRFWIHEPLVNMAGVEIDILLALGVLSEDGQEAATNAGNPPTPNPSPRGGGGFRRGARRGKRTGTENINPIVPSPLVGEGQGEGDCRAVEKESASESKLTNAGSPPTPNPSPRHAGGVPSARRGGGLGRGARRRERIGTKNISPIVPSPLVGEGQGGGDGREVEAEPSSRSVSTSAGSPPTPSPSPRGGGGFRRGFGGARSTRHG